MRTKTHLINYIARIGLLMMVLAGMRGETFAQWNGVTYYTDQTINMTGDVTMTGVMTIDGCTVTIKPNGASRTINRGSTVSGPNGMDCLFYLDDGGVLKIEGTSSQTITINCNNYTNIFPTVFCAWEDELDFDYVTIQNANQSGFNGSAILMQNETVANLNHCKFYDNKTSGQGGAIYMHTSTLNCTDCEFKRNSAGTNGGAVFNYNVECIVNCTRCVFQGNTAQYGGALRDGTITLTDCTLTGNKSTKGGGGGIYVAGNLTLTDCTITGNSSQAQGGGVYFSRTATANRDLKLSGEVVIKDNSAATYGPNLCLYTNQASFNNDISPSGLDPLSCGSSIGVTVYYLNAAYPFASPLQFANGTASDCRNAYSNHYFFVDGAYFRTGTAAPYTFYLEPGDVYYSTASPYSDGNLYVVPAGTANSWDTYADASGCTVSGGYVTHVNTAAGLAYLAKDIATGKNYSGKTVLLTADLNMAGHNWEPIGCTTSCSERAFAGTFNGQGHTITGLSSTLLFDNMGLFGYVTGTVKNLVVASSSITSSATNLGGIVGELNGGSVYNCISTVTLSGGTNRGALVGKVTSGSLLNSFAVSNDAVVGTGTATNCYVRKASGGTDSNMGTATNTGASGNTTGAFTHTVTPYRYRHDDNKVGSTALLTLLNAWVDAQTTPADLAHWSRTCASPINGDYPLLMMPGAICVGSNDNTMLQYRSSLNTMMTDITDAAGHNIFLYDNATGVTAGNANRGIYIAENAALIHTSAIANAYVGVTLKDAAWHMFSPAISNAPLGINYNNDASVYNYGVAPTQYAFYPEATADGYFPSVDFGNNAYYADYDYYCYYEPEYHWINFKRNTPSHWHEDLDHPNIEYHWDNTPTNSSSLGNETNLKPGKGYLLGIKTDTYLQSHGTLNPSNGSSDVTFPVTMKSGWRTGYNLIGNPYQAYLDFNAFATENSGSGKIWSSAASAFYLMIYGGAYHQHVYGASNNELQASRCLHPHQGFMVITENDNVSATFKNSMRKASNATNAPFRDEEQPNYTLVNLIITDDSGESDLTTIELDRPDRGGAPKRYDLHLSKGCIYTHYDDTDYAIAFTQPGISEIGVRFESEEENAFTMTWDMENGEFNYLHLIDNMTGTDIDCLLDTEYHFTSRPSDYKSRFRLVFDYTGIEEPSAPEPVEGPTPFAFMMGDELVVNGEGTLQMFDMMGRQVMQSTVSGTQTVTALPQTTAGVYVIRLSNNNGTRTQKIIIE